MNIFKVAYLKRVAFRLRNRKEALEIILNLLGDELCKKAKVPYKYSSNKTSSERMKQVYL